MPARCFHCSDDGVFAVSAPVEGFRTQICRNHLPREVERWIKIFRQRAGQHGVVVLLVNDMKDMLCRRLVARITIKEPKS